MDISIPTGPGLALKSTFDWLDGFAAGVQAATGAMKDKLAQDLVTTISSQPPETKEVSPNPDSHQDKV